MGLNIPCSQNPRFAQLLLYNLSSYPGFLVFLMIEILLSYLSTLFLSNTLVSCDLCSVLFSFMITRQK